MSALSQKTLQVILEKKVQPIPLWRVYLKNGLYWIGVWVFALLTVFATALSWHILFEIDWDAYEKAQFSWSERIWSGVPFFSLILLSIFLVVSVCFLRITKRGYRYQSVVVFGLFLVTSITLGYFFEGSPIDEPAEKLFMQSLPQSQEFQILPSAERQWSQPEKGLLGGSVVSSDDKEGNMQILDTKKKAWEVDTSKAIDTRESHDTEEDVKIIGSQKDDHTFEAKEIRTWKNHKSDNVQKREKKEEREEEEENRHYQDFHREDSSQEE